MINVYYGAADRDRDRFLFDMIGELMPEDTILLVPDQFTLQAERNAFEYMNTDTLLELEIMSRSSFTNRIISQEGGPSGVPVDRYGRYMLLTKLMMDQEQGDGIFAAVNRRSSFITKLNDLISEMKQYGVTPEQLAEIAESFSPDEEEILHAKLTDISVVYEKYQEIISGKYTDSEDFQEFVTQQIYKSRRVAESHFWVDGFDYMTPKMLLQLEAIACTAKSLNIVMTGDAENRISRDGSADAGVKQFAAGAGSDKETFAISVYMRKKLREIAERNGIEYRESHIPEEYSVKLSPEVSVIKAGDHYAEAESIAMEILELVREKGYRYSDIVIICNDSEKRGSVFRRVFEDYGIPLFIDRKRVVTEEPVVEFIFSMLDVISRGRVFSDVFRMLKTGYGPVSDDMCEELENYCRKYNIRSGRWKNDFRYGLNDEGQEKLDRLNQARAAVDAFISEAEELFKGKETVTEKTQALYTFIADTAGVPERLAEAEQMLEEYDLFEFAQSCAQIWDAVVGVFEQLAEVIGDSVISDEDYAEILAQGFAGVEIGVIPTNNDQVIFGTMQRTRTGRVKAMFVAGVNEGVLPEINSTEGILSDEEKQLINDRNQRISRTDDIRDMEQRLSLYKNITKAQEILCFSYAEMDSDGNELRPSELIDQVITSSEDVRIIRDHIYSGDEKKLIQTPESTLSHLTYALRRYMDGEPVSDIWKAAALVSDGTPGYETAKKGLFFRNDIDDIQAGQVRDLFGRGKAKELILSTSAIEKYSRCPFSFFVSYGLRPYEERSFEVDVRSIGDIYHDCLRKISDTLTEEGIPITSPESKWLSVTENECRSMISEYVDSFADTYREGVFNLQGREAYIRDRIKDICYKTAWIMIQQVRSGRVKSIYFEQRFGRRSDALFPPVEIDLGDQGSVYIEGIIDRTDVIETEDGDRFVRVIDYKSGNEKFDVQEVLDGWRLQLMIYMKGATGGIRDAKAGGVFYFSIKEKPVDASDFKEDEIEQKVAAQKIKDNLLDGVLLNNEGVIESMDTGLKMQDSSEVISVRRKKDGTFTGKCLLSDDDFEKLIEMTDYNLHQNARALADGNIPAAPKKTKDTDACRYCSFKSICGKE